MAIVGPSNLRKARSGFVNLVNFRGNINPLSNIINFKSLLSQRNFQRKCHFHISLLNDWHPSNPLHP